MRAYTLHLPPDIADDDVLDRARLVPDGFAWLPFLLGALSPLWFFAHRLWLAGLGVLLGFALLFGATRLLDAPPGVFLVAHLLLALLIGLEANALRRWSYARRGRLPAVDVVAAPDRDTAEVKLLARWTACRRAGVNPASAGLGRAGMNAEVLGLFPEPDRGRRG